MCTTTGSGHLVPVTVASEALIPRVCAELEALSPGVIVPAHCTGWAAQRALADRFPAAFIPSTVGTRFELSASRRK